MIYLSIFRKFKLVVSTDFAVILVKGLGKNISTVLKIFNHTKSIMLAKHCFLSVILCNCERPVDMCLFSEFLSHINQVTV